MKELKAQKIRKEYTLKKKKIKEFIKSNNRQVIEILCLVMIPILSIGVDFQILFKDYLANNKLSPDNFFIYFSIANGLLPIVLFFALLFSIHRINSNYIMNSLQVYHDYPYWWYLLCTKILGIKKCSLVLVPIHMQFKLVIRNAFDEYPLDEKVFPIIEGEENIVANKGYFASCNEINIIIEDTYQIMDYQIPKPKSKIATIKISRNDGTDKSRHYSPKLIEAVNNAVRDCPSNFIANVFATTNPMNTLYIAKSAFALGERGTIKHLYVFQQGREGNRVFDENGYKIF